MTSSSGAIVQFDEALEQASNEAATDEEKMWLIALEMSTMNCWMSIQ